MPKTLRALGLTLALLGAGCASTGSPNNSRSFDAAEAAGMSALEAFKFFAGWVYIP